LIIKHTERSVLGLVLSLTKQPGYLAKDNRAVIIYTKIYGDTEIFIPTKIAFLNLNRITLTLRFHVACFVDIFLYLLAYTYIEYTMTIRSLIFFLMTSLLSAAGFAQSINTAKLDSFFNVLSAKNKIMGSFAIAKKGEVVYKRSVGYSNDNVPASENTLYHIGSVTKVFTATMIFQLIKEGKLSLNATLNTWFPQIPNAKQITIEMLLDHRSGLFDFVNDVPDELWITKPHTKNEILNKIITGKVNFLPNADFAYSNSGYLLLAYIIEKITRSSFNESLQKRICSKIGLKNTYSSNNSTLAKNGAASYAFATKWEKKTEIYFPNVIGAGDILSTPTDLIAFDEALLDGKLVSAQSLNLMKAFKNGSFGMGIDRIPFGNHTGYGHGGDTYGTHALVAYFIDDKLTVTYCINGEVYPHNDVAMAMLSICYGTKYAIPAFKNITVSNEILNKYTGVYYSTQASLKITVTINGPVLLIQLTGESAIVMDAMENNVFKNDAVGAVVEFNADKNEMTLKQNGESFLFRKDKER
jgi:D-alanyl-D-alanine carboxypeptidase